MRLDYPTLQAGSELTGNDTVYTRKRSAPLGGSDMPSVTTSLDTETRNAGGVTTSVTSAWLVVHIENL